MALMGFLTSWPTPEVRRPMAARRRESSSSLSSSRTDSRSCRVSRAPREAPGADVLVQAGLLHDEIEGDLDAASGLGLDLLLVQGAAGFEGVADQAAELGLQAEDAVDAAAEEAGAGDAEEALDGVGDQGGAALRGEEQDAVLQVRHDRVEVLLEGGEDLLDIAHAAADALDLVGDLDDGVLGGGPDERGGGTHPAGALSGGGSLAGSGGTGSPS